ncbi:MAG: AarF/ABC1/UbiB kinase family protein [Actinobacteria bacterium]|nr:MAG: AarF/ABC1/UbiB kinase family protein [Actinomycetota bacterium]
MDRAQRRWRNRRVRVFARVFAGIIYDFWREERIARKHGRKIARARMSARHRERAAHFRETAVQFGGVIIKLGQFLSARADVLPEEYIQELKALQDEVPAVPFEAIKAQIESEFGRPLEDIFVEFDPEPIAAASLAQVHNATLADGEPVAVKVQRPGLEELVDFDLAVFRYLMDGLGRYSKLGRQLDLSGLAREFSLVLGDELDFHREGHYAQRFKANFDFNPIIYIPSVHWEYSTDKVLTLEHVEGIKISDYAALEAAGISRNEVAREVVTSYLQMVLEDGFFHADPHPGNIFVRPGPVIVYVDFGMAGEITSQMRAHIKDGVVAGTKRDMDGVVTHLMATGFVRRGVNVKAIKNAIQWLLDNYAGMTADTLDFDSLESIQEDLRTIMYENPFTIPTQFAFLARAVGTLLGLTQGLDPHFDYVAAATPYVDKLVKGSAPGYTELVVAEAKELGKTLLSLPRQTQDVLTQLERGELRVRVDARDVASSLDESRVGRSISSLVWVVVALIGAAVALRIYGWALEAGGAAVLALAVLVYVIWRSRSRKRHPF